MKQLLAALLIFSAACNPQLKPATQKDPDPQTNEPSATATFGLTKFGILVNPSGGRLNTATKIKVAKALGLKYVRNAVIMEDWTGADGAYEEYVNAGLKVILNINAGHVQQDGSGTKTPFPFPTDTVEYKKKLGKMLDKYRPELVVIENEETTKHYHSGTPEDYITELTAAIGVAHSKGIKVTNGGIAKGLDMALYRDFISRGMRKEAEELASQTMDERVMKGVKNPGSNPAIEQTIRDVNTYLQAYKKLPLDYVNVHLYDHTPDGNPAAIAKGIKEIAEFVTRVTGKPIMTNECGQKNSSPETVKSMMNAFIQSNYKYAIWFSGDNPKEGGAVGLNNADGSLRANGLAFKDFMKSYSNK